MQLRLQMRKILKKRNGQRFRVRAQVERFGEKHAFRGPPIRTILLCQIIDVQSQCELTDHMWMTCGKWSSPLSIGDMIEFNAREKGYKGYRDDVIIERPIERDYRLERPSKVEIVCFHAML